VAERKKASSRFTSRCFKPYRGKIKVKGAAASQSGSTFLARSNEIKIVANSRGYRYLRLGNPPVRKHSVAFSEDGSSGTLNRRKASTCSRTHTKAEA
jgi:hypothetical protein